MLLVLFSVLAIFEKPALCKIVTLFSAQKAVQNYEQLVHSIENNDTLEFDGHKIKVLEKLGQGGSDLIFKLDGNKVIRIPKRQEDGFYKRVRESYLEMYPDLKSNGVHTVKVFEQESKKGQYIIAEFENVEFDLEKWISTAAAKDLNSPVRKKLIDFAKSTARLEKIGDLNPEQVIWNGNDWKLLDWAFECKPAQLDKQDHSKIRTVFESAKGFSYDFPPDLLKEFQDAIYDERHAIVKRIPEPLNESTAESKTGPREISPSQQTQIEPHSRRPSQLQAAEQVQSIQQQYTRPEMLLTQGDAELISELCSLMKCTEDEEQTLTQLLKERKTHDLENTSKLSNFLKAHLSSIRNR